MLFIYSIPTTMNEHHEPMSKGVQETWANVAAIVFIVVVLLPVVLVLLLVVVMFEWG